MKNQVEEEPCLHCFQQAVTVCFGRREIKPSRVYNNS